MNKNAIVTYIQDQDKEYSVIISKRMKAYASKCKADILEFSLPEDSYNLSVSKIEHLAHEIPKKYQRFLILNSTVMIRKDSPSLFDMVPNDQIALYNEVGVYQGEDYVVSEPLDFRWSSIKELITQCKLSAVEMPEVFVFKNGMNYYNSGVMLHNKKSMSYYQDFKDEQLELMREKFPVCAEQIATNYLIKKFQPKVYHLPVTFNQMPYNRHTDYLKTSFFVHYSIDDKQKRMSEIVADHEFWAASKL